MNLMSEAVSAGTAKILAVSNGGGSDWFDVLINLWFKEKTSNTIIACTLVFIMGCGFMIKMRPVGFLVWLIGIPFCMVFFTQPEWFYEKTDNTIKNLDHKPATDNPFKVKNTAAAAPGDLVAFNGTYLLMGGAQNNGHDLY
ncbi:Uncharacterised protein [Mycobacteroides abscessus subsp. abscessus]|uniref:hypothetical protein n=1 Tax=Mycobacteroides abscessus TaxID=36809 RepID=UPI00092C6B2F|nr:hypothetical protein [Mycobacteroides abscessus]SIA41934.1 Uncharacterised protein [Mycobacteroides abscessus subsp. abscessus]SIA57108.1 Uncharacterised protein [Mycobacteroides abscessus subsp. abscessus]